MMFAGDGTRGCNALAADICIRRFDGKEGLEALQADWNRLTQSLQSPRFVHLHGWYRSYLEALEPDPQSVHFFALYRDGSPVAIFPLKASARRLRGIPLRSLALPQHPHLNLCDAVFERSPENAGLLRALVSHLEVQSDLHWDVLDLRRVLEDSAIASSCSNATPSPRLVSSPRGRSSYVSCLESPETMSERLAGSFRRNLRRLERRAQELGKLEYRSYRTVQELPRALAAFVEVEASGWKGSEGEATAIACDASLRSFYSRLAECFAPGGECVVNLLWLNDVCVAGQFGLIVDRVLYIIKIGYHENYSQLAPGNLLMERVLAEGARDGALRAISFVTDPPWGHLWRPESLAVSDFHVFNRTWRGWAGCLAYRSARRLGRSSRRPRTGSAVAAPPASIPGYSTAASWGRALRALFPGRVTPQTDTAPAGRGHITWLALAVGIPPLVYPLLVLSLVLEDCLVCDQEFLYQASYEVSGQFIASLAGDWLDALPGLYGITLPLWVGARTFLGRIGAHGPRSMALVGGIAGAALAAWLAGTSWAPAVPSFSAVGAVAGAALGLIGQPLPGGRAK